MAYKKKKQALPVATAKNFSQKVKEILELRDGVSGSSNDAYVTLGELLDMDLVGSADVTEPIPGSYEGDGDPPDPPTDLSVTAGFLVNELSWTNPDTEDAWYIEVWVSTTQSRSAAVQVASVAIPNNTYKHTIPVSEITDNHYYWIRTKDYSGLYSTWEPNDDQGGYLVETQGDIEHQIDEVMDALKLKSTALLEVSGTLDSGDPFIGAITDGSGSTVDFVIGCDTFRIVQPSGSGGLKQPFIVGSVDGVSTIGVDGNMVIDGTLLADSIAADAIKAVHLDAAEVFVNTIQSADYVAGSTGWKIDSYTNEAEFNDLIFTIGSPTDVRSQLDVEQYADNTNANETFSQDSDINALNTTNGPNEANADRTSNNTADDTNHANNADVDSGYLLTVYGDVQITSGGDLALDGATIYSTGTIVYIDTTTNFAIDSSANVDIFADDDIYINTTGGALMLDSYFSIKVYQDVFAYGAIDLGSTGQPWTNVYCGTLHDNYSACLLFNLPESGQDETYDCLNLISQLRPLQNEDGTMVRTRGDVPKLDKATLPKWCTNYHELYQELRKENGDLLNKEDFQAMWEAGEFSQWRASRDMAHTGDLAFGAIMQLNQRLQKLEAQ